MPLNHPDTFDEGGDPEAREQLGAIFERDLAIWAEALGDPTQEGEVCLGVLENPEYDELIDRVRAEARARRLSTPPGHTPRAVETMTGA